MNDNNSGLWAGTTLEIVGATTDACFASESYGEPFAKALGPKVDDVRVNQSRAKVPINGASVR